MKVVTAGSYSEAGLAALADATYDQRRAAMDELYSACGGKIIDYFFCDGDANYIIVAEIPNREVHKGMLNNALATGSNRPTKQPTKSSRPVSRTPYVSKGGGSGR